MNWAYIWTPVLIVMLIGWMIWLLYVLRIIAPIAMRYLWNILIALDQFANALLAGDPDETISSRAAKRQHLRGWRMLGRVLEWIDPGHLAKTREDDEGQNSAVFASSRR